MKTHVKTGVLIFFLTVLSVAGIQPGKAKADSIKIAGNMVLNEVKDVDIEGHHYEAILFRVSQNVANNETYAILQGLKSNENSLVIPAYIEGIPVKEITEIQDSTVQYGTKCFSHDDQGYYVWSENSSKKYDTITIQEVIDKQLAVVDLTASIMCMENHVQMAVFSLNEKDGIVNAMRGKINGTVVTA